MEQNKHQQEALNQQSLKIVATKILLPVSIFSVILSYITFLLLILQASIHINKDCMFLVCNGILVLIATNSGLITNSTKQETQDQVQVHGKHDMGNVNDQRMVVESSEKTASSVAEDKAAMEIDNAEEEDEEQVTDEEFFDDDDDDSEEEVKEEEEEEEAELLSTEELNRKCEEFIRKMRAEIKFEA